MTVDVHLSALFPRILWIVDSTIRSRRFDKIYDFFVNLWMLSASPRKLWCRDLLYAEREGERERERMFSGGCAPERFDGRAAIDCCQFFFRVRARFCKDL